MYFRLMVHPSLQFIYESFPIRSYFSLWDLIASVDTFWRVKSNGLKIALFSQLRRTLYITGNNHKLQAHKNSVATCFCLIMSLFLILSLKIKKLFLVCLYVNYPETCANTPLNGPGNKLGLF